MKNKDTLEIALAEVLKRLNVLISLSLRQLSDNKEFGEKKARKGAGDFARYLSDFGIDAKDISEILGAPLPSVRTLLTPKRRKS
jgi:hypothetical protein